MAENYKHLYEQMKKMVELYQDEIVPQLREQLERAKQPTWIPLSERLPTEEDATNFGLVLAVFEDGKADAWLWHTVAEAPERFEKWKPIFALPQPPKGDEG